MIGSPMEKGLGAEAGRQRLAGFKGLGLKGRIDLQGVGTVGFGA